MSQDRNPNDAGDQFESIKEAFDGQVDIRPMLSRILHRFGGPVGFADDLHLIFKHIVYTLSFKVLIGLVFV